MDEAVRIEPVPAAQSRRALHLLAWAGGQGLWDRLHLPALKQMLDRGQPPAALWWAVVSGRPVAAAIVLTNPGRSGTVFCTMPETPGVRVQWLSELVAAAGREALAGGLAFVQSLVAPSRRAVCEVFRAGGFDRLTELVYMRRALRSGDGDHRLADDNVRFCAYGEYDQAALAAAIKSTYADSQDCPRLYGLRTLGETIAAHKCGQAFQPRSWWIAMVDARAAGCLLLNASPSDAGAMDVAYMGVAAWFRRRGLGRRMLRRAATFARAAGREALTVAVDGANDPAMRLYAAEGFAETDRRVVYLLAGAARATAAC